MGRLLLVWAGLLAAGLPLHLLAQEDPAAAAIRQLQFQRAQQQEQLRLQLQQDDAAARSGFPRDPRRREADEAERARLRQDHEQQRRATQPVMQAPAWSPARKPEPGEGWYLDRAAAERAQERLRPQGRP